MTTFAEQLAIDIDAFFNADEFAESATYNGAAVKVVEAQTGERVTGDPGFATPQFSIYLKASDVPRPKGGDTVTFRGTSCRVMQYSSAQGGIWLVDLVQNTVQA